MILVGWLSDLPAIASSGEAGGIAQKAISYHFTLFFLYYYLNPSVLLPPLWIFRPV
jgi:hypothetical protein